MLGIGKSSRCIGTKGVVAMLLPLSDSSCSYVGVIIVNEATTGGRREVGRDAAEFIRKYGTPKFGSRRRLASICFENYSRLSHSYVATWSWALTAAILVRVHRSGWLSRSPNVI
jgi:hypothetical protein